MLNRGRMIVDVMTARQHGPAGGPGLMSHATRNGTHSLLGRTAVMDYMSVVAC